ncbi:protein takeout [Hyalella azteca]|uniref:Protein takeout n=1 Tax=Hyalella azteca TaxID=294128 RepID=A0A8B7ND38_HYAAZ|nr:protein takeout [Hyalella azteca]
MAGVPRIILALMVIKLVSAQDFGTMVRKCRENHAPRFNECIVQAVRRLQPRLSREIPELNLQRVDPLRINNFVLSSNTDLASLQFHSNAVDIAGLSKFDLTHFDIDFEGLKTHVEASVPSVIAKGDYNISGRVFGLPIHGEGDFIGKIKGMLVDGHGVMEATPGGQLYVTGINFNFKFKDLKMDLKNLFNGNEILSRTVAEFMNSNSQLVLDELTPELTKTFSSYVKGLVNNLLSGLPQDLLTSLPNASSKDKHRQRTLQRKTKAT